MTDMNQQAQLDNEKELLTPEAMAEAAANADLDAGLDSEMVTGKVAEVAGEEASEDQAVNGRKTQATQTTAAQKDDFTGDDRSALRARLLQIAPREQTMRAEVVKVLQEKKVRLESDIRAYKRRQEYHLLSAAVAQLRAVIRQLEIVAKAGYEALKEIWLKVVHKFA